MFYDAVSLFFEKLLEKLRYRFFHKTGQGCGRVTSGWFASQNNSNHCLSTVHWHIYCFSNNALFLGLFLMVRVMGCNKGPQAPVHGVLSSTS